MKNKCVSAKSNGPSSLKSSLIHYIFNTLDLLWANQQVVFNSVLIINQVCHNVMKHSWLWTTETFEDA